VDILNYAKENTSFGKQGFLNTRWDGKRGRARKRGDVGLRNASDQMRAERDCGKHRDHQNRHVQGEFISAQVSIIHPGKERLQELRQVSSDSQCLH